MPSTPSTGKNTYGWTEVDREPGDDSDVFPWFHRRDCQQVHIAQVRDKGADGRYWVVDESFAVCADESLAPIGRFVRSIGRFETEETAIAALRVYVKSKESHDG